MEWYLELHDGTEITSLMDLTYDFSTCQVFPLTFKFNQGTVIPEGTCSFASDDIQFGYYFTFDDKVAGFRPLEDADCSQYPYDGSESEAC